MCNKRSLIFILYMILLMSLFACLLQPVPQLSSEKQSLASLLVKLDSVKVKRDGWKEYQSVDFGTLVYPTDLLQVDGEVTLLCPDMQTIKTLKENGRNPCPLPLDGGLQYEGLQFTSGMRGSPSPSIPYILYPRNTLILETHPEFRWHDTGAMDYTLELWQGTDLIWTQSQVSGNIFIYPKDAPNLLFGRDYLLVVVDNVTGKSSAEDPNKGLGFQVVNDDQRAELDDQRNSLMSLVSLDFFAQKTALALYYSQVQLDGRSVWGESVRLLNEVIQEKKTPPALYLRLGDVLVKIKLEQEARTAYETALIQAQALSDLESQAEALAALWHITGDKVKLDEAIKLYGQLGAQDQVSLLQQETTP